MHTSPIAFSLDERANAHFDALRLTNYRRTDRLFGWLMPAQWVIAVIIAATISPQTWAGAQSAPHLHLYAALCLGGVITVLPATLAWMRPGGGVTRYAIAAGQLLMAALLIHLTGGRIETHFYIFCSLAFLVAYHDWRVLLTGAAVIAVDHVARGLFWPESVFGVLASPPWRIVEHALYVVVETAFLTRLAYLATRDQREVAERRAESEARTEELDRLLASLETQKAEAEAQREAAVTLSEESDAQRDYLERSVDRAIARMDAFADGDLTVHLQPERDDAIARLFDAFNRAVAQIREMIAEVERAAAGATRASADIGATAAQLAAATQEQSVQAQEVAAAVEEMTATIVDNARASSETSEMTMDNGRAAEEGGVIVSETVAKIRQIADIVGRSTETVERLGRSSSRIGEIAATIEDIADQTNLLALNAAIEAARAGEHGRGFAVVADEVRKLAERTTHATAEIAEVLGQVQTETGGAVEAMRRGNTEVDEGLALADRAGEALRTIIAGARRSSALVAQIAAASEEQASTSEEMARSVSSISTVAAEAAQGVSLIAAAGDSLGQLTQELREVVGQFRTGADRLNHPNGDGHALPHAASVVARPAAASTYDGGKK